MLVDVDNSYVSMAFQDLYVVLKFREPGTIMPKRIGTLVKTILEDRSLQQLLRKPSKMLYEELNRIASFDGVAFMHEETAELFKSLVNYYRPYSEKFHGRSFEELPVDKLKLSALIKALKLDVSASSPAGGR